LKFGVITSIFIYISSNLTMGETSEWSKNDLALSIFDVLSRTTFGVVAVEEIFWLDRTNAELTKMGLTIIYNPSIPVLY
jgi:hypothetical protein